MNTSKLRLEHLRNEAHVAFFNFLYVLLAKYPAVKTLVLALYTQLTPLLVVEKQLVDAMHSSDYTPELTEADNKVDNLIVGIERLVESYMHHYNPVMVASATRIANRLKVFGRIEGKFYGLESAAIKILIDDLDANYAADISNLGLPAWLSSLTNAVNEFDHIYELRNAELSARPEGNLKAIRKQINTIYRSMVAVFDANSTLNNTYAAFINELSREVKYRNEQIPHHVKKDIQFAVVNEVPPQKYTGKEIVVSLDAFDPTTDERLVEGKDYNYFSRRNIKPGTASQILSGKGAYRGQRVVTFTIYKDGEEVVPEEIKEKPILNIPSNEEEQD